VIAQVDFEGGLEDAWENVATFVPKLLGFFLILLIGWFICKAISKLVNGLLERVGFDRWVERGSLKAALDKSKFDASDILATIVFWGAFLFVLQLAFGIFGENPISDLLAGLIAYLPKVFVAVLILVITAALAKVVSELLDATLGATSGGSVIAKGAGIAILVVGVFAALNQLEIAPEIVNGLFYALLAVIVGSAIVAFGGGGIPVARRYLERWSTKAEDVSRDVKQNADPQAGKDAIRQRIEQEKQQAQRGDSSPGSVRT
jgi:hypothetical protein